MRERFKLRLSHGPLPVLFLPFSPPLSSPSRIPPTGPLRSSRMAASRYVLVPFYPLMIIFVNFFYESGPRATHNVYPLISSSCCVTAMVVTLQLGL